MALILVNLAAVVLQSMPAYAARFETTFDVIEYISLVVFTVEYGFRVWSAVEHGPHRDLSNTRGPAEIYFQRTGPGRSDRRAAVLADAVVAAGFPLPAGLPHGALLQDRALFASDALAARCAVPRAPRAVRLRRHGRRRHPGAGRVDAPGRRPCAARQARHHSRCDVVGNRHPRYHRLWRRRAGDRLRQAGRHLGHFHRRHPDRAAGRHHRHRFFRAGAPPRFALPSASRTWSKSASATARWRRRTPDE